MACKRVLITSGPAAVPIDGMRVITNRSTGDMGRLIAAAFARQGARVTLLEGQAASSRITLPRTVTLRNFFFYDELARLLSAELERGYDVVIHAAAVPDFRLLRPFKGKISSGKSLQMRLVPTKKLISGIRKTAPRSFLVGFKLGTRLDRAFIQRKARLLFRDADCGIVVANAQDARGYRACLVWPDGTTSRKVGSKQALVRILAAAVQKHI